jgi:hypothetical protein
MLEFGCERFKLNFIICLFVSQVRSSSRGGTRLAMMKRAVGHNSHPNAGRFSSTANSSSGNRTFEAQFRWVSFCGGFKICKGNSHTKDSSLLTNWNWFFSVAGFLNHKKKQIGKVSGSVKPSVQFCFDKLKKKGVTLSNLKGRCRYFTHSRTHTHTHTHGRVGGERGDTESDAFLSPPPKR